MAIPRIIELPKFLDERGNLSFFENDNQLPFAIKRVHWIYDVPGGEERGGLAYKETEEFIVALSGSFDVEIDNGLTKETFSLNRSYYGLYVPKGIWREMNNFSTNSLALVLSSTKYDENDYKAELSKYIATPQNQYSFEFLIGSIKAKERKWIGRVILIKSSSDSFDISYSVKSKYSDGSLSGVLKINIQ